MKKYKIISVFIIAFSVCLAIYSLTTEKWVIDEADGVPSGLFFNRNVLETYKQTYAEGGAGTADPVQLMARAINGEARGEPYEGQVAVGAVIINRTDDPKFPNTIPGVIYQPGAFTAVSDGQINLPLSSGDTAYKAARDALNGWDPTGGCIYYFNPATATNSWIWSRPQVTRIGKHIFAK